VTLTFSFPHHTAVVARVRKRGPKPILDVLHQNARVDGGDESEGGRKVVRQWMINLAERTRGTVKAYRPVPDRPAEAAVPEDGRDGPPERSGRD
jgi:hypothetical protein